VVVGGDARSVFVALLSANGHTVETVVSEDRGEEFVPRIEDPSSGRWVAIVEPSGSDTPSPGQTDRQLTGAPPLHPFAADVSAPLPGGQSGLAGPSLL
jgi:hypothetical protein